MRALSLAWSCLATMFVWGCTTLREETRIERVEIADALALVLPGPGDLVDSLDATQIVTGTYGERTYNMQVQLEWRPGSIVLAALNVWGTALFTISYDGQRLATEGSPTITSALRPEYVLADILLTFSSRSQLRRELLGDGVELEDDGRRRILSRHGRPVIVISYGSVDPWGGAVHFEHLERNYVLNIETVELNRS